MPPSLSCNRVVVELKGRERFFPFAEHAHKKKHVHVTALHDVNERISAGSPQVSDIGPWLLGYETVDIALCESFAFHVNLNHAHTLLFP